MNSLRIFEINSKMELNHHHLSDENSSGRNNIIPRGQVIDVLRNLNVFIMSIYLSRFERDYFQRKKSVSSKMDSPCQRQLRKTIWAHLHNQVILTQ